MPPYLSSVLVVSLVHSAFLAPCFADWFARTRFNHKRAEILPVSNYSLPRSSALGVRQVIKSHKKSSAGNDAKSLMQGSIQGKHLSWAMMYKSEQKPPVFQEAEELLPFQTHSNVVDLDLQKAK